MIKLFLQLFLFSTLLFSHPVMWKGALDTTYKLAKDYSDLQIFYTFNRAQAVGFHSYHSQHDSRIDLVHYNQRLFRQNRRGAQQNFYALVGFGQKNNQSVSHLGFQWDWETRRLFTLLKYDAISSDIRMSGRFGFAPYLGDYNDWHTWLMVEYQSNALDQQYVNAIIPLIRLFKDNYLFEVGFGELYFVTIMVHF